MSKQRSPNRDKARALWEANPEQKLKDIAEQLGVSEGQIRKWKSVDKWDKNIAKNKVTLPIKKSNVTIQKIIAKKMLNSVENNEDLLEGWKDFCLFFASHRNAAQAYRDAFSYTGRYANRLGYEIMQKKPVREEIDKLLKIRRKAILMSGDDVVERMMLIAFADITSYVEFGVEERPVVGEFGVVKETDEETGEEHELTYLANYVRFKNADQIDGTLISEVKQGKDGVSVKLADRMKALEWLTKYFVLFPADRRKADYDKRKLEIEEQRFELEKAKAEGSKSNQVADDWIAGLLEEVDGDND